MGKTQVVSSGQKALHSGAPLPTWIKFLQSCLQSTPPLHPKPRPDFRNKRPCPSVPPPLPQTTVNDLFPLPYGEWRPVTNGQISSNIISSNTALKMPLKENYIQRHTPPRQVALLVRTDKSGREQECLSQPQSDLCFWLIPLPGLSPEKPHLPAWLGRWEYC